MNCEYLSNEKTPTTITIEEYDIELQKQCNFSVNKSTLNECKDNIHNLLFYFATKDPEDFDLMEDIILHNYKMACDVFYHTGWYIGEQCRKIQVATKGNKTIMCNFINNSFTLSSGNSDRTINLDDLIHNRY